MCFDTGAQALLVYSDTHNRAVTIVGGLDVGTCEFCLLDFSKISWVSI